MRLVFVRQLILAITGVLAVLAMTGMPTVARERRKPVAPPPLACERATYRDDPVCDLGAGERVLPLPSSRKIRRADDASGFVVGEGVSVDGKTNFNENRFGEAPLHKFHLKTQRKDTNGGAQIDLRF